MTEIFRTVLNMSITGAYIAAVIMLLRLPMKKLPKKYSYMLWSILGIRLLCPLSFSSAASLFNLIRPETKSGSMTYIPDNIEHSAAPEVIAAPQSVSQVNEAINGSLPAAAPNNSVEPLQIIMGIAAAVWLLGAVIMLIYTIVSYLRVRKTVSGSICKDGNIYVCGGISSPFVYGIIKPKIYIPEGVPEKDMQYIAAHERTHISRGDHIIKLAAMAALCLHWFNPLVWISYRLMVRDMELSCDERAVRSFGEDVRRDYANALLNMSVKQNRLYGILAFGESNIKSRIKSVLGLKKPTVIATAAAVLVLGVAAVCLLTNAESAAEYHDGRYATGRNIARSAASSFFGDDDGYIYDITDTTMTVSRRESGETVVVYTLSEWQDFPYSPEEWTEQMNADFVLDPPDISRYTEKKYMPLDDIALMEMDGELWICRGTEIYSLVPIRLLDIKADMYTVTVEAYSESRDVNVSDRKNIEDIVRIVNSAELTEISRRQASRLIPEGGLVQDYSLNMYDGNEKRSVRVMSPHLYSGEEYADAPRVISVTTDKERFYTIPAEDWYALCRCLTGFFPVYTVGDYRNSDGYVLGVTEDGFSISKGSEILYSGSFTMLPYDYLTRFFEADGEVVLTFCCMGNGVISVNGDESFGLFTADFDVYGGTADGFPKHASYAVVNASGDVYNIPYNDGTELFAPFIKGEPLDINVSWTEENENTLRLYPTESADGQYSRLRLLRGDDYYYEVSDSNSRSYFRADKDDWETLAAYIDMYAVKSFYATVREVGADGDYIVTDGTGNVRVHSDSGFSVGDRVFVRYTGIVLATDPADINEISVEKADGDNNGPAPQYVYNSIYFPANTIGLTEYSEDIFSGLSFIAKLPLPYGWEVRQPEEDGETLAAPLFSPMNIYDGDGNFKGTIAFNRFEIYDGTYPENYYRMVYNQLMLGSVQSWDGGYVPVRTEEWGESAVTTVRSRDTLTGEETLYPAVLCYNKDMQVYIGVQFVPDGVTGSQQKYIAENLRLSPGEYVSGDIDGTLYHDDITEVSGDIAVCGEFLTEYITSTFGGADFVPEDYSDNAEFVEYMKLKYDYERKRRAECSLMTIKLDTAGAQRGEDTDGAKLLSFGYEVIFRYAGSSDDSGYGRTAYFSYSETPDGGINIISAVDFGLCDTAYLISDPKSSAVPNDFGTAIEKLKE
ncbi:MAG: M56 family metallopeptidase [Oscillospiraceae bacterium]